MKSRLYATRDAMYVTTAEFSASGSILAIFPANYHHLSALSLHSFGLVLRTYDGTDEQGQIDETVGVRCFCSEVFVRHDRRELGLFHSGEVLARVLHLTSTFQTPWPRMK